MQQPGTAARFRDGTAQAEQQARQRCFSRIQIQLHHKSLSVPRVAAAVAVRAAQAGHGTRDVPAAAQYWVASARSSLAPASQSSQPHMTGHWGTPAPAGPGAECRGGGGGRGFNVLNSAVMQPGRTRAGRRGCCRGGVYRAAVPQGQTMTGARKVTGVAVVVG